MRLVLALVASALLLTSCTSEQEPTATLAPPSLEPDEFALEGFVVDAKEGAKPSSNIEGLMDDADVGGIAIRPEEALDASGLDGCTTTQDAYVTYYTAVTDAGDLRTDDDWPEALERRRVKVEGTRHEQDEDASPQPSDEAGSCVLVLDRVELVDEATSTDDGSRSGSTGAGAGAEGTASPDASGSPSGDGTGTGEEVEGGFGSFPPHEDTDPIFEGTPSPDPCEGAKACEEKRKEAEAREEEAENG